MKKQILTLIILLMAMLPIFADEEALIKPDSSGAAGPTGLFSSESEESPNYYLLHSASFYESGNYKKAIKDLKKALEIYKKDFQDSDFSQIYLIKGIIEAKMYGENIDIPLIKTHLDDGSAVVQYSDDFKTDTLSPFGYKILYQNITKGIEDAPNNPALYTTRAVIGKKLDINEEKVLNDFNRALEINPDYYPAITERGQFLLEEEKYDEALRDYSSMYQIMPHNYYILWKTGDSYLGLSQFSKARMYYNMSLIDTKKEELNQDDMNMYMESIKKMVDVQTKENSFRDIISNLNLIIREYNNKINPPKQDILKDKKEKEASEIKKQEEETNKEAELNEEKTEDPTEIKEEKTKEKNEGFDFEIKLIY